MSLHIYIYICIYIYIYRNYTRMLHVVLNKSWKQHSTASYFSSHKSSKYFAFLNIHHWLNIANITPHGPDDGLVELKRYSVNFSINLSFHLDYLVINFSTYCQITILYLLSHTHTYIYINWITMTRKSSKHFYTEHWTAVSTLLGLISSAYHDLHSWRLNQQLQTAEPKLYHWATGPYHTEAMPS